jgi:hypothetical protein
MVESALGKGTTARLVLPAARIVAQGGKPAKLSIFQEKPRSERRDSNSRHPAPKY